MLTNNIYEKNSQLPGNSSAITKIQPAVNNNVDTAKHITNTVQRGIIIA